MKKDKTKREKKTGNDKVNGEMKNGLGAEINAEDVAGKNEETAENGDSTALSSADENDVQNADEKSDGLAETQDDETADEKEPQNDSQEKLDALKMELRSVHEKYMRKAAEFENFRKRKEKEVQDVWLLASAETIKKFLPVIDDLDRSIASATSDGEKNFEALVSGIELVQKTFLKALESEKVERIKAVGEPFDPEFHEALMQMEKEGVEADVVIDEHQPGYKVGDKVLRPAKVLVSK